MRSYLCPPSTGLEHGQFSRSYVCPPAILNRRSYVCLSTGHEVIICLFFWYWAGGHMPLFPVLGWRLDSIRGHRSVLLVLDRRSYVCPPGTGQGVVCLSSWYWTGGRMSVLLVLDRRSYVCPPGTGQEVVCLSSWYWTWGRMSVLLVLGWSEVNWTWVIIINIFVIYRNSYLTYILRKCFGLEYHSKKNLPDSKVHGANMGPTWILLAPDGPHAGPMNLAIRAVTGGRHLSIK